MRSKSQASTRAQPKKNGRTKRRSGGGRKTRCPVLWTEEEDECLKQAVAKCSKAGPVRWPDVAQLPGLSGRRTGKQCRERFINHLCSSLKKKDEWSPHEDFSIVSLLFRMGTKWSVITPFIPGRTDNGEMPHQNLSADLFQLTFGVLLHLIIIKESRIGSTTLDAGRKRLSKQNAKSTPIFSSCPMMTATPMTRLTWSLP